jgi:glycosyltransferase involved in cell wall biosynthesis
MQQETSGVLAPCDEAIGSIRWLTGPYGIALGRSGPFMPAKSGYRVSSSPNFQRVDPAAMVSGMHVLFSIHDLALNGAVVALLQQVRYMRGCGDSVTVLTRSLTGSAAALEQSFRESGAEIVNSFTPGKYDVLVGCTVFAADVLERALEWMPTAWWIHEGRAGVDFIVRRSSAVQTLMRVGKLIFPSRGAVERLWSPLLGTLPPGRVDVIPYLIPPPPSGEAVGRQPGVTRVVCVGTISPRKRQIDLLQAISMLPGASVQCVLIGENQDLEPPDDELIRANPSRFLLTGGLSPEAVQTWYRSSDVFCLPSADECMPIAPVEAAWHGIPIVLADLECYEDVWRHGINALVHRVGDAEMLAWYLRMLIESPSLRARFSKAAREVALRFTEQRGGALFNAALQEAIAGFG